MRALRLAVLVAALALGAAAAARGESNVHDGVLGSFEARLSPSSLPRERPAPIAVRVAGDFRAADGGLAGLKQLRRIDVALNREGRIFDQGLPVCRVRRIQPSSPVAARRVCGDALVGTGHVHVQVRLPDQTPYVLRAPLLAFNGPRRHGHRLILAQAYLTDPPASFVITFEVRRKQGLFGTVLTTRLPPVARKWAWITHFDLSLHRTFTYRGRRRSYVAAACAAPAGFRSAVFPFARAAYTFAGDAHVAVDVSRVCRVAE